MPTSVDVVIPVHNQIHLTERCLRHLQAQTLPHRVIVVDGGSSDATGEILRQRWPAVEVQRVERRLGFAEACNRGATAGDGEVIVLLNNDVDCRPDFLERLLEPLGVNPAVGAVAALMLRPGEESIDSLGLCADVTLAAFPRLSGFPATAAAGPAPILAAPAGAAAAYRREAWRQVGGLDESIVAYLEDFDLGLRLRCAGWEVVAAPNAVGVHLGSATHGHRSATQRRLGGFSRGYLLRRYGVPHGRHAPRTLLTEAIVAAADFVISRDLAALRGRLAGWRAARGLGPRAIPAAAIDSTITFADSLAWRRRIYGRGTL